MRKHGCRIGNGRRIGNCPWNVADTVVYHPFFHIPRILMRGLMEGLQSPLLIIADIHNDSSIVLTISLVIRYCVFPFGHFTQLSTISVSGRIWRIFSLLEIIVLMFCLY